MHWYHSLNRRDKWRRRAYVSARREGTCAICDTERALTFKIWCLSLSICLVLLMLHVLQVPNFVGRLRLVPSGQTPSWHVFSFITLSRTLLCIIFTKIVEAWNNTCSVPSVQRTEHDILTKSCSYFEIHSIIRATAHGASSFPFLSPLRRCIRNPFRSPSRAFRRLSRPCASFQRTA